MNSSDKQENLFVEFIDFVVAGRTAWIWFFICVVTAVICMTFANNWIWPEPQLFDCIY